jgi:hypothetical protein
VTWRGMRCPLPPLPGRVPLSRVVSGGGAPRSPPSTLASRLRRGMVATRVWREMSSAPEAPFDGRPWASSCCRRGMCSAPEAPSDGSRWRARMRRHRTTTRQ